MSEDSGDERGLFGAETDGGPVIDATVLAERFGLTPDLLMDHLRRGFVRSRVEIGTGDDAGTRRLSVRIGNRIWIAIVNEDGGVLSEEMRFFGMTPRDGRN
ncbi:3-hydroxyisobutyrate dehydrogenase-like beta-hydroxyacid dehydrogenase [Rhizobium sp. BK529]|uniref:DUF6522 family protein n=1 Tax=unclassified Rhizobium TaxID=2613769 RepID=UPI00104F52BB|nr:MULTISPECIES: DUF6522 family protein [unclassified Rhizobium]MBB3593759.1 3-hydroxyisobutyrate dehydrogenase-like beta-hydroxyacid dehydrogenase [Rhizobium sp. BK529]TCR96023.1 hypothetical protein EV281_11272 [Rhizobium sp. BK418]